ncbi:MAG: beta galactosidase jelly roll domain-containing protein [Kiritimatiellaeota bacterium]|nr:beta galactosidase jelly roll domain-containing protein [Kiritimatiellota bacterium]
MFNKLYLKDNWHLKSTFMVKDESKSVSGAGYNTDGWYPVSVPTTVLNALVKNSVYPDPRVGLNNFLIPDASDEYNAKHDLAKYSYLPNKRNPWRDPYWYRTEFNAPANGQSKTWLNFNAINYRAEVWLNGIRIAGPQEMVGAFLRFRYDVTGLIKANATNCLAVKVYGVDHPGMATTQLEVFQACRKPVADNINDIRRDVTINVFATGYDCVPEVRDRLMGIWQDVYLEFSGPVVIRDPFIKTKLPLPRTDQAHLTVSAKLINSSVSIQKGVLRGELEGKTLFKEELELQPGETRNITLSPEQYPGLTLHNPRLWWPAGYGEQQLYKMTFVFETGTGISDRKEVSFGVREVTKVLHELDGDYGLRIHINGQKIFCRGGYLLPPDTLLDSAVLNDQRYKAEMQYLTRANLNTISMEEPVNMPDNFFDFCDKHGLMFWLCFYQCNWLVTYDHPLDHKLLERCGIDIIKRYRNHPSIVVYMCMNEGRTEQDQYNAWRKSVAELDNTRIIVPSGYPEGGNHRNWPEWIKPDTPVGANDAGPKSYSWQSHSWYYRMVREHRSWMFKIESGSASLPTLESIRKIIPDLDLHPKEAPYPLNSTWAHHGANDYYRNYDRAIRRRYGEPESVADYCWKAHLVTADQHRAMFEAIHHRKWDITSGFMQWKLNSCWPDIQWQLYDYYLRPTPSYYYIKNACEPLHVQMSPIDSVVTVVNHCLKPQRNLKARARVYGFDMQLKWEKEVVSDIAADAYRDLFAIPPLPDPGSVYFVKLELFAANNQPVSDNFYWLSSVPEGDDESADLALKDLSKFNPNAEHHLNDKGVFVPLKNLPKVKLLQTSTLEDRGEELAVRVKLSNPSPHLAFFIHVAAVNAKNDEEILPVYWDDNYFSILPGATKNVTAILPKSNLGAVKVPGIRVEGWNICDLVGKIEPVKKGKLM